MPTFTIDYGQQHCTDVDLTVLNFVFILSDRSVGLGEWLFFSLVNIKSSDLNKETIKFLFENCMHGIALTENYSQSTQKSPKCKIMVENGKVVEFEHSVCIVDGVMVFSALPTIYSKIHTFCSFLPFNEYFVRNSSLNRFRTLWKMEHRETLVENANDKYKMYVNRSIGWW